MKLLLDEMLPATIAAQLRERGQDVTAVQEVPDLRGLPDRDLFTHAQEEQRSIVTYNREDFLALDRQYRDDRVEHNGIVVLNPQRFPQGPATIGALIASLEVLLEAGPPYPAFIHWLQ